MKFIHAADIHLDSPLVGLERYDGAPIDEVRGATRRALQNLVELALSESVDFVLIAGDLYDGDWKDYNTGLFFVSQMAKLRDGCVKVVIVTGNHDAAGQITKNLRLPDNCKILSTHKPESFIIKSAGAVIHGRGFASRAVTDDLAANYPKPVPGLFNVGLLHTCLDGREGHEPYAPTSLQGLMNHGYDYWALGHIHKRETISREPWIVFPGNSQGRNVRETGAKGCMLVSVTYDTVTDVEFRSLDVLRWSVIDVDISGSAHLDGILDALTETLKGTLPGTDNTPLALRIRLYGSSPLHGVVLAEEAYLRNEIRACAVDVGNGNIWVEKVLIDTAAADRETPIMREDALGGLLRSIHDLQYNREAFDALFGEFRDLFRRLPPEYLNDGEAIHPDRETSLARMVEDVKHMLLNRIAPSGDNK